MANIFLKIGEGIEVAAKDALKFFAGANNVVNTAAQAEPAVVAALGAVFGAVTTAIADVSGAAEASGLNIALDVQTVTDLKAVLPKVEAFLLSLGIKL